MEPKKIIKQTRNRLTETENKLLFINGETTGGGARQGKKFNRYKLLAIKK